MKDPDIRIGFIIFNNDWKREIPTKDGHRKTAYNWIVENKLLDVYNNVVGSNNIYDEEDFLIEYVGAIKLYASRGTFYCRIPRIYSPEKSYVKRYYSMLGYKIISDGIYDEEKTKVKTLTYQYNKTVVRSNSRLIYNPLKDGD